jgi:hypothetical protein
MSHFNRGKLNSKRPNELTSVIADNASGRVVNDEGYAVGNKSMTDILTLQAGVQQQGQSNARRRGDQLLVLLMLPERPEAVSYYYSCINKYYAGKGYRTQECVVGGLSRFLQ